MAKSRKTPAINAVQMADIAFILLIFFMMVTTMGSEFGMVRMLPPWSDDQESVDINERNIFVVNINQANIVGVRGVPTDIREIRAKTKEFFDLSRRGDNDPEKELRELDILGPTWVNKGAVVSLQNDRGTSYRIYMQVQNELTAAIRELRDEFCMQRFGTSFEDSTPEQQDVVGAQVFPVSISEAEPRDMVR
jgi:biopolymer transport protein ExbD